ncbi:phytoene desaturase family protein [Paenarthrobacter aurescens]|uniref:Pyridine nucleotide-disulfide oxidoreductase domain-containing protein 2 n=1 Tax=Paenarthrobacter aurescens TaxID=43663 RepID=A0A4Y3NBV6_PAEAU|nr:NAD(P)/FAD-dependent oxidoreductase [Paenarthrobacter aurescens]MDO6141950.1 NAD(P)/FAD-dependent oxidoreductase [Paenarthrobacter aurescens]MDO6145755.1 NAD(P)/FAD-dependent oxidoreductase [Paenarthrobacter aurescens]MDO6156999.1 NAD(P)/FAD-dependent oxidoreductase [Paenarthrobacter aurescens]MDO6160985.1 NAD(P)/FAD-dependent oxidoreductase [Paenarthrobacter aurescens]GEB19162.1 FAD-dependent oxidoreductase [Paenarthrobacter aurescens]
MDDSVDMDGSVDVAIIGSGINSLVAAAELALAGKRVCIIELSDRLGGFIHSAERTLPGFLHDSFSSWHPLFVSGAAYGALGKELHARGLEYCNTTGAVTASVASDPTSGAYRVVIAHRDPAETAAAFKEPRDEAAYLAMLDDLGRNAGTVFGAFGAELRSFGEVARIAFGAVRRGRFQGTEAFVRDSVMSGRNYVRSRFDGWETDQLWSPWLLHAGLGPDQATGGVMLPVMAMSMHSFGLPIVKGGASRFVEAFESLLRENGVRIMLGTEAQEILVAGGSVAGVRTSQGVVSAGTVLANVSPQALYTRLLRQPPAGTADAAERYQNGRGAMQVHLALDKPVEWLDPRLNTVPLVHISNGSDSTGIACAQAEAGLLPNEPTVVVGQQCVLDPSRAPEGKATLWLQLQEVPFAPVGDAAGELSVNNGWTDELKHGYLERVLARLEQFAPGTRATVLAADILAPTDLAAANPNAVNGDPYGGSAELFQNLLWRPFPAAAGHQTGVEGLWHIGASTHPGPGLSGGSGHLVAQKLTAPPSALSRLQAALKPSKR